MKHHVIYIPGLGDDVYKLQSLVIKLWRLYGVHGHCHAMPWAGEEAFEPKFQKLLDLIDKYADKGHKVSLVGASAGASAVINAYVERRDKIASLAYITAKIKAPETVKAKTYRANPAFKTSMYLLQRNLSKLTKADKAKMHSFYSQADTTVPYAATVIPGVKESRLPDLRHSRAIAYALTLGAPRVLSALKKVK